MQQQWGTSTIKLETNEKRIFDNLKTYMGLKHFKKLQMDKERNKKVN